MNRKCSWFCLSSQPMRLSANTVIKKIPMEISSLLERSRLYHFILTDCFCVQCTPLERFYFILPSIKLPVARFCTFFFSINKETAIFAIVSRQNQTKYWSCLKHETIKYIDMVEKQCLQWVLIMKLQTHV